MTAKTFVAVSGALLLMLIGVCGALYWMVGEVARRRDGPPPAAAPVPVGESDWAASLRETLVPCWSNASAAAGPRIRIGTYNLENFSDGAGDGTARTEAAARRQATEAAALVARFDPDILIVQEVENARALAWLNEGFARPYPVAYLTRFGDGGHPVKLNIGVLSRLALDGAVEIDFGPLSGPAAPPRGILRFAVPVGADRHVLVYGVHLKSNYGDGQRNQAKRAAALRVVAEDLLRLTEADPATFREALVMGDMNVDPDNAEFAADDSLAPLDGFHDLWRGRGLAERTTVPTRHGDPYREFPPAAFDRILVAEDLLRAPWRADAPQALAAGVNTADADALPGRDGAHVSDHYPVYVDLYQ